jgi:hypothetical protein
VGIEAKDNSRVYNPTVHITTIIQGYDGRLDTSYALNIWSRHDTVQPKCDELLIIGGIFGYSQASSSYHYPSQVKEKLLAYLSDGVKVKLFLQSPKEEYLHYVSMLFSLDFQKLYLVSKELIQTCLDVKTKWLSIHPEASDNLQIFRLQQLYSWEYHGLYSDVRNNPDAISHTIPIYQMLRAQFKSDTCRFLIYEHKNDKREQILLDEDRTFRARFLNPPQR